MKCKFDTTGKNSFFKQLFVLSAVISLSFCFALLGRDEFTAWFVVSLVLLILSVIGLAAVLLVGGNGGTISALENEIVISRNSSAVKLPDFHIRYNEIELAEYKIKDVRSRVSFWYYKYILIIKKKSGKEVKIAVSLDIEESLPLDNPEKYKKYINEQPLMKMCKYINERLKNNE